MVWRDRRSFRPNQRATASNRARYSNSDSSADHDGNGDYEPQTCIPCPPQDVERGALIAVLHDHDCGEQHDGGPYHETSVKCPPGSALPAYGKAHAARQQRAGDPMVCD